MAKCFKCGGAGHWQWRVCSDGPWRWVCKACDLELNRIALQWAFPRAWKKKLDAYEARQDDGQ